MSETPQSFGETLVQIRIELGILGEKMDQVKDVHKEVKAVEKTAEEALQRSKVSENRINDLESTNTWLWRTVAASIITGVVGLGFMIIQYFIKNGG